MIEIKINFAQITQRVEAARSLQDAGQDDDAKSILRKLSSDLQKSIGPSPQPKSGE